MQQRVFALGLLFLCVGCITQPGPNFYQDAKFELSPAEMRQVIVDHGGTIEADHRQGDAESLRALMWGSEMREGDFKPEVLALFAHGRMKVLGVAYPRKLGCEHLFENVRKSLMRAFGEPQSADYERASEGVHYWLLKWHPPGGFVSARRYVNDAGSCGFVSVAIFSGSEAEWDALTENLD